MGQHTIFGTDKPNINFFTLDMENWIN